MKADAPLRAFGFEIRRKVADLKSHVFLPCRSGS
jgi:hypothetical protein